MSTRDFHVLSPPPPRGDEMAFSVSWHDETLPCWSALAAGLDRRSMGLAVGAMDSVRVYRTAPERRLWLVADVRTPSLVRSVSWANGSVRGWDVLGAAGKDGVVRILELRTVDNAASRVRESGSTKARISGSDETESALAKAAVAQRAAPSGISAGLAGLARGGHGGAPPEFLTVSDDGPLEPGRVRQQLMTAAEMPGHGGSVWRVGFSFAGTHVHHHLQALS